MKIDDTQISFGKFVLIEKSQRPEFLSLVDSLCDDVDGSFLHCVITGTGWVTIIRYSKLLNVTASDDYCLFRILLLKDIKEKRFDINYLELRRCLRECSSREIPYVTRLHEISLFDSCPIICPKETLAILIKETIETLKRFHKLNTITIHISMPHLLEGIEIPFSFSNRTFDCESLYGFKRHSEYSEYLIPRVNPPITMGEFNLLSKAVYSWKLKLKRKGVRALKKNITLETI
jgi:hypothetical protein